MAAGLATLEVIEQERLVDNAARVGAAILAELEPLVADYELLCDVRGRGMMIGLEFTQPRSLSLKASWNILEAANKGLFCQMITVPLFMRHRILSQVAGHGMHIVKFIPPLTLSDDDRRWIVDAVTDVVADAHRVPGSLWDFGTTLARQAIRMRVGAG